MADVQTVATYTACFITMAVTTNTGRIRDHVEGTVVLHIILRRVHGIVNALLLSI
jgi:hypothetical protein